MIHGNLLEAIGHTPIVRLNHLTMDGAEILVKLESFNPTRSIKDRAAYQMVRDAERLGLLRSGGTIVESTSGNLGRALALVGAVRKYRVILVVDTKTPVQVVEYSRSLGAEIEMIDAAGEHGNLQAARIARARDLAAAIPGAYWPNQYDNPSNPEAHRVTTAREILDDLDDGIGIDAVIASASTGGHLRGISDGIRAAVGDSVKMVGVDVPGSAAFGGEYQTYKLRGLGLAWEPSNLREASIDFVQLVDDRDAVDTMRELARSEGILVGESSGAVVFAALTMAARLGGGRIVAVLPDDGMPYLGESFQPDWTERVGIGAEKDEIVTSEVLCRRAARSTSIREFRRVW